MSAKRKREDEGDEDSPDKRPQLKKEKSPAPERDSLLDEKDKGKNQVKNNWLLNKDICEAVQNIYNLMSRQEETKDLILVIGNSDRMLEAAERSQIGWTKENQALNLIDSTASQYSRSSGDPSNTLGQLICFRRS